MANALQPLFDLFWNAGKIIFNWTFEYWIKPKTDFEPIFNETKLHFPLKGMANTLKSYRN